ncbi:MAG: magnesium transporter [Nitrospinae bacterium]|nr:magnesium transporter [Nitrospinota bacterium]
MPEPTALLPLVQRYIEKNPVTAARHLESMTEEEAIEVLHALPRKLSAKTFQHLQVSYLAYLLKTTDPEIFKDIIKRLPAKKAATVVMHLPEDARDKFLPYAPKKVKEFLKELLTYPEDSVSQIMVTDFMTFRKTIKVRDAIRKIRSYKKRNQTQSYCYVIEDDEKLIGVLNMYDIILATQDTTIENVMNRDFYFVPWTMDREEAASELSKRRYSAVPVLDNDMKIIGVIKAEHLIKGVQTEVSEDVQKMFGVGGDERAFSPLLFSLRMRLPWLHVNLLTAFLAASVVALFEDVIAKITILAVFLPVVAGQGGNAGAQSLAVVMRGIFMREIPENKAWSLIGKESLLGLINGAIIGIVTALVAWVWDGNPYFGVVIGLGMLVNLFIAGMAGASIPIFMKKIGLDPAQCSNIILTTVTDVIGFFAFLGFAVLFIDYLVV